MDTSNIEQHVDTLSRLTDELTAALSHFRDRAAAAVEALERDDLDTATAAINAREQMQSEISHRIHAFNAQAEKLRAPSLPEPHAIRITDCLQRVSNASAQAAKTEAILQQHCQAHLTLAARDLQRHQNTAGRYRDEHPIDTRIDLQG